MLTFPVHFFRISMSQFPDSRCHAHLVMSTADSTVDAASMSVIVVYIGFW